MILETDRLILREMTINDAPFLFELMNTADWLKYIGDRKINSIEAAKEYLEKSYLGSYEKHGFGAFLILRKTDKAIVGTCGLYKRENLKHPDIGFALLPQFYKLGYAFEASTAVMEYAKEELQLNTIFAITVKDNINSILLLRKLGLSQVKTIKIAGDTLLLFSN